MTISDLLREMGYDSVLQRFYDDFLFYANYRDSPSFFMLYGRLYGYLCALREQGTLSSADFFSVAGSIRKEGQLLL